MPSIQYSGNKDDPNTFTQRDMERLIKTYNSTIDAILYVLNYTERSNKTAFERSLEARGIDNLDYADRFPHNKIISCVGMASGLHKEYGLGSLEPFSSLASLKIRNAVSEYEQLYADLEQRLGKLHWAFQTDMIFAYDKLCGEVKKIKSKYKNVIGLHKIMSELEKNIHTTAMVIGSPENECFTGSISIPQAIVVRQKLSDKNEPIYPLHMYRDIMRLEEVKEVLKSIKREKSRSSHYDKATHDLKDISDKNIELAEINHDLEHQVAELEQENADLRSQNAEMAQLIADMRRGFLGQVVYNRAQRKK